ncbi:chitin disaccharide deacetylase [Photobacterium lipolyticum]|uniref:Chitin disaccharide deacetylase n=1 Tax=Photobacterium lipolyticum TaxID=266810 RepID=A0A2T3MTT3_9GAMM|nr:chitin disaccharide deacetylase [Photobacterium lipolyticum]PSW02669.1 chitin disaccharide deacetylase [Photobacterium lipolyticum]
MHVIFNADDFGLTPGVNLGIVAASQSGVVRSTTLMVSMAAEKHAIDLASSAASLKLGLHLRFTAGAPLTAAHSLTCDSGQFLVKENFWHRRDFSEQQIADEVTAQVEHFLASGLSLSHIDSHHHAHTHPQILPVVQELARFYKVPLRECGKYGVTSNDCRYIFSNDFYGDDISVDKLLDMIKKHKHRCDVLEIMCHPAYIDQPLLDVSSYNVLRAKELAVLTDGHLHEALERQGVEVCDFSILSNA